MCIVVVSATFILYRTCVIVAFDMDCNFPYAHIFVGSNRRLYIQLLEKHAAVFELGLGTLGMSGGQHANRHPGTVKFHKACSVPYSMWVLGENELDRLTKEDIIEPIDQFLNSGVTMPVDHIGRQDSQWRSVRIVY